MKKKRFISALTALALVVSMVPTPGLAAGTADSEGLCPHHTEHTTECGYLAPSVGAPCIHEHTAKCYTLGVLPEEDSTYIIDEDAENLLDCPHVHDEECGYVEASPGTPCTYECHICPVQELIDTLPDVTSENAEDAKAQLSAIDEAKAALTDDELDALDIERYAAAISALNALEGMEGAEQPQTLEGEVASVTINGTTTSYATIDAAFKAATSGTATIKLLGNATATASLQVPNGADITLDIPEGLTLTSTVSQNAIEVVDGGKLTITGGGTITTTANHCVEVNTGATFTVPKATTVIFESTNIRGYGLYVDSDATVTLSGGTFKVTINGTTNRKMWLSL